MGTILVNGQGTLMPLEIIEERAYTRVRDLAEAIGARVLWNPATQDVQVVTIPWPDLTLDLRLPSNVTPNLLHRILAGTELESVAGDFVAAEGKYRINALIMAAHAALESAWGTSQFARERNNLFGIGAWDSDPNRAMRYATKERCIDWYAKYVTDEYLRPGGQYFHTPNLSGMSKHYATDQKWGTKIVKIARDMLGKAGMD